MDTEKLVKRAKNGDTEAFGLLYVAYAEKMKGVCINILRHDTDIADDLVHDAFVVALMSVNRLRDPKRFGEWLTTITRNITLKYINDRKRENIVALSDAHEEYMTDPESGRETYTDITTEELISLTDRLPEGYRHVFRMSVVEGLSHKEIAETLGIRPHTSSSQLYRAKNMLRKILADSMTPVLIIISMILLPVYKYFETKKDTEVAGNESTGGRTIKDMDGRKKDTQQDTGTYGKTSAHIYTNATDTHKYPEKDTGTKAKAHTGTGTKSTEGETDEPKDSAQNAPAIPPSHPESRQYTHTAANKGKKRLRKWEMVVAGSVGPALAHNIYKMISTGGNSPDIDTSIPANISTWEELHEYLSAKQHPGTPADTTLLTDIAKSNSGKIVEREKHEKPVTIGITLTKKINSRTAFESGLQYSLLRSSSFMGGENHIRNDRKIHYIGIPLRMSYRIADYKKLSAYCTAGMVVNIPIGGRSKEWLVTDTMSMCTGSRKLNVPFQWSVNAGAGIQYDITPNIGVYIEPTLNYHIPTGSGVRTTWSEHPFSFSVPFGIRLTW